mgnify:CR=1 FL=1
MITISLRMDKKRLAALVLVLALAGAGAVCAKQMLWQNVLPAESTVSARKVNTAAANEQQRRILWRRTAGRWRRNRWRSRRC